MFNILNKQTQNDKFCWNINKRLYNFGKIYLFLSKHKQIHWPKDGEPLSVIWPKENIRYTQSAKVLTILLFF